eukprot:747364-Hanusia_phi.AAC.3
MSSKIHGFVLCAHDAVVFMLGLTFALWIWLSTFFAGNVVPIISMLFLKPFAPWLHEIFLDCLANVSWNSIIEYAERVCKLNTIVTGNLVQLMDEYPRNKLILCNHVSAVDVLVIFFVASKFGKTGNLRFFAKKELIFVPIFGLAAYFLNFVFLERNWIKDMTRIKKNLLRVVGSSKRRLFWLVIFPEGTRIDNTKLKKSQEFAISRNLQPLKHLLIPRVKGPSMSIDILKEEIDAILDLTIAYDKRFGDYGNTRPSLVDAFFKRRTEWNVHVNANLIPVSDIPKDKDRLDDWLHQIFVQKDGKLEHYHSQGSFPDRPCNFKKIPEYQPFMHIILYSMVAAFGLWICIHAAFAVVCFSESSRSESCQWATAPRGPARPSSCISSSQRLGWQILQAGLSLCFNLMTMLGSPGPSCLPALPGLRLARPSYGRAYAEAGPYSNEVGGVSAAGESGQLRCDGWAEAEGWEVNGAQG